MGERANPTERFHDATWSFINTELETAETFADIALESDDSEKVARNKGNTRKGYDTARRFLNAITLTPDEERLMQEKLDCLGSKLLELGESL
jgi:hypothetical protein